MLPKPTTRSTISADMKSLNIIYASTSGNTEYVVSVLVKALAKKKKQLKVTTLRAEEATAKDLTKADMLMLGSGSWNTGGIEGQMNPHMHSLLLGRAKDVDLKGKKVLLVALGDDRYYYTCRSGEHMRSYVNSHGGELFGQPLLMVNDPYGQEAKIEKWVDKLLVLLSKAS